MTGAQRRREVDSRVPGSRIALEISATDASQTGKGGGAAAPTASRDAWSAALTRDRERRAYECTRSQPSERGPRASNESRHEWQRTKGPVGRSVARGQGRQGRQGRAGQARLEQATT